jgi:hypothetical protein
LVFVVTADACVQRLPVCLFYHANVPYGTVHVYRY